MQIVEVVVWFVLVRILRSGKVEDVARGREWPHPNSFADSFETEQHGPYSARSGRKRGAGVVQRQTVSTASPALGGEA